MDTTKIIIWIVIVLVVALLIWLLRKWIKRLIFIILVLGLAFFIFGLFNPSGASRLWYNVRTLPDRVVSRFSDKTFIDYEGYQSSKNEEAGSKIDFSSENDELLPENSEKVIESDIRDDKEKTNADVKTGHSFIDPLNNVSLPELSESKIENNISVKDSDGKIMKALEEYLGKNLDKNTDVLVTLEYEENGDKPEKIILKTQKKSHFSAVQRVQRKNIFSMYRGIRKSDEQVQSGKEDDSVKQIDTVTENKPASANAPKNYNGLTQKEVKETEELFSILFG